MTFKTVLIPLEVAKGLPVVQRQESARGAHRHVYQYADLLVTFGTRDCPRGGADELIHQGWIEGDFVKGYRVEPVVISKTIYNLMEEPHG